MRAAIRPLRTPCKDKEERHKYVQPQSVEYDDELASKYEKRKAARANETDSIKSAEENNSVERHTLIFTEGSVTKKREQSVYGDDSVSLREAKNRHHQPLFYELKFESVS